MTVHASSTVVSQEPTPKAVEALTILIVDDDAGDRTLCQRSLRGAFGDSLQLLEADSGEGGLESIEKQPPACILLDYSLSGINGIEVLKRIRAKYPYLPVVMIDGKGNDIIAVQSMKEGAQDYIVKSTITPATLHRAVQMAINHGVLQKREQQQRTSLEIFTRALAHDLKEPVRTMRSFLDRIGDWRKLCEASQHSFQYIRKSADRMGALIDAVHLYTRLDGAQEVQVASCDLTSVLDDVQENLAKLIQERGATIECEMLPKVQADTIQMRQLFQNLLANAIQHGQMAVKIHVSAQDRGDNWQIVVRDNGPGVDSESLEAIFAPFKRLAHRKEDDGERLGLGLAISRKIVEMHGGRIWCESQLSVGTSFVFTLPKETAIVAANSAVSVNVASPSIQPAEISQSRARILLVDDSESDIELNNIFLIEQPKLRCEVLTARDGKEGLAILRDAALKGHPIDLVMLDINMPVMNGFEMLTRMKKERTSPSTVVVMCTTSDYDEDRRMAKSLGAAGYLTKPPKFSVLKDIIERSGFLRVCQQGEDYVLLPAASGTDSL